MPDPIPRKQFYKMGEVCQLTDTQPYVLRFWESEFSRLAPTKTSTGQRLYRRKDVDLVLHIKRLLYEEGFTIAAARKKLGMSGRQGALDELLEPREMPTRAARGNHTRAIIADLQEILRIMEQTDRRLRGPHGPRSE